MKYLILVFISLLITSKANAFSLESECEKISYDNGKIVLTSIKESECLNKKVNLLLQSKNKKNADFIIPSSKQSSAFVIEKELRQSEFCKVPSENIAKVDLVKKTYTSVWNSFDNFNLLIGMTNFADLLILNKDQTTGFENRVCFEFPGFSRARYISKRALPVPTGKFYDDSYIVISSRLHSLFFMSKDFKKVVHVINMIRSTVVLDALVDPSGDLVMFTTEFKKSEKLNCIERWDLLTNTQMSETCGLPQLNNVRMVVDNDKLLIVHSDSEKIFFDEFRDGKLKNISFIENAKFFNLQDAFFLKN